MLLTKEVEIKINKRNIEHFKSIGYLCELKDVIIINSKEYQPKCARIVKVKCEFCGKEKELSFRKYIKNTKNLTVPYSCSNKCSVNKYKKTCLERYGVDNAFKVEEFKEKQRQCCIKRFGVDNVLKSSEFRTKMLEMNKDIIKENRKKHFMSKYGVEYYSQTQDYKDKCKKTNLKLYGNEIYFRTLDFKEKNSKTIFEKYGVEYYSQTQEHRDKTIQTNLRKYGVEYYSMTDEFKLIIRNHHGFEDLLDKERWEDYKKIVVSKSHKYYKQIKQEWDGMDYYTNEYIRGETIDQNHPLYPNIDHKISIKYGFLNKIDIDIISDISNLCVCSRQNNIRKSIKTEEEYIEQLKKENVI